MKICLGGWLASRSSHRARESAFAKAPADSLRKKGERGMLTQFTNWNQMSSWLRLLQGLQQAA